MAEPFLRLVDVSKVYQTSSGSIIALKRLNVSFLEGEFDAVLGPSGSGKTTLLSIIAGLVRPTKGFVIFEGRDLTPLSEDAWAILRRANFGFVFQSHNLIGPFSAYENIEIPLIFAGVDRRERKQRINQAMVLTETSELLTRRAEDLSGGEQQRVAIARALVTHPRILLADEPTGDLDTETSMRVMETLGKLARIRKMTVVVATHDPVVVEKSDRVLRLRDGSIKGELEKAGNLNVTTHSS